MKQIIALQVGTTSLVEMNPDGRKIHIFTDSLSCLQQLATLPYKFKYTNAVVNVVAENLAALTDKNEIELHFIPSHTKEIPQSDKIDELAKQAAITGDPIDHSPLISSYKLAYKKYAKIKLQNHISSTVENSQFRNYPKREPLRDGCYVIKTYGNRNIEVKIFSDHLLLNRTRTGHTCARSHLKNIGIETDDKCRHCNKKGETVKHQLIECTSFDNKLRKYRNKYHEMGIADFNDAIYTQDELMGKFITKALHYGCYI